LPAPADQPILRVHWAGIKALRADTNATHLLSIWDMPETARLREQTLDKLALASWRLLEAGGSTNDALRLLRPLLDHIIEEECYFEMHSNNPALGFVFAIRLDDEKATIWDTNLAQIIESQGDATLSRSSSGWTVSSKRLPTSIQMIRSGGWMALSGGLQTEQVPNLGWAGQSATGPLLVVEFDSTRLLSTRDLLGGRIQIGCSNDSVRTTGSLRFRQHMFDVLPAWKLPTGILDGALTSFTALRGVESGLTELMKSLGAQTVAGQVFLWSLEGSLTQTYGAIPVVDSVEVVSGISPNIMNRVNSFAGTNELLGFRKSTQYTGLEWTGLPFLSPFIQATTLDGQDYVVLGLFSPRKPSSPPQELLEAIAQQDLVCYDWELTGIRIQQWLYIFQFLRFVTSLPQLPDDSASLVFLKALTPKLGNCVTRLVREKNGEVSLTRQSGVGFTALELHLLADWLESPSFPFGVHTLPANSTGKTNGSPAGPR